MTEDSLGSIDRKSPHHPVKAAGIGSHAVKNHADSTVKNSTSTVRSCPQDGTLPPQTDLTCPSCRDEALYQLAVELAVDAMRKEGIRCGPTRRWEFPPCECPVCFCSALARDHDLRMIRECMAELAREGEDVLPECASARWASGAVLVPTLRGWVTPAELVS